MPLDPHVLRLGYVLAFGLTAVGCAVGIARAIDRVSDPETRWGLVTLLAASGVWASAHVGRLVVPQPALKLTFYLLGLAVGLASVGAWLYFCSAYAGETYHRQPRYRRLAVAVYLSIVAVKFTSPIHGLYFSTTTARTPFPHLVIELGALHWIVTGLAYALSAIGFYLLFDLFQESSHATRRLAVLVGLAGLPAVFDLVGYLSPGVIITLNYEPIGVAVFALGALYVADGSFLAVRRFGREQLLENLDEGIVLLDDDGAIRDLNTVAQELFPALADSLGEPLATAVPEVAEHLPGEGSTVIEMDGTPERYYLLSTQTLTAGRTPIGRALVLTDVTEVERGRRAVERQHAQMDAFAEAITHELRNTLTIAEGHIDLASERLDPDANTTVTEALDTAADATERMTDIVSDLAALAQYGRTVEETERVEVAPVAERAWAEAGGEGREFVATDAGTLEADEARLERLFENLFRFALGNGATRVELTRVDGRLVVTDDGAPLGAADVGDAFAYGEAVPDAESGLLLPVVRTLAEAHGWTATVDAGHEDGVRVLITP